MLKGVVMGACGFFSGKKVFNAVEKGKSSELKKF